MVIIDVTAFTERDATTLDMAENRYKVPLIVGLGAVWLGASAVAFVQAVGRRRTLLTTWALGAMGE